ncbi:MAG: FMN-binding protein [Geopsychrobacter sp.]|nr:FMN-binding protein [Geopsychrobacter sp.]
MKYPGNYLLPLLLMIGINLPVQAWSGLLITKDAALKLAFPNAERVETVNLFLTEAQMKEVKRRSGVRPDSPLYTFYRGMKGQKTTGYAAIEAATVRTRAETVLVVFDPAGRVRFTEILAFFEPPEYMPSKRWLDQFRQKKLSIDLRVGGEIHAISGATLSAQAITRQVRKSAALCAILRARD